MIPGFPSSTRLRSSISEANVGASRRQKDADAVKRLRLLHQFQTCINKAGDELPALWESPHGQLAVDDNIIVKDDLEGTRDHVLGNHLRQDEVEHDGDLHGVLGYPFVPRWRSRHSEHAEDRGGANDEERDARELQTAEDLGDELDDGRWGIVTPRDVLVAQLWKLRLQEPLGLDEVALHASADAELHVHAMLDIIHRRLLLLLQFWLLLTHLLRHRFLHVL
eukprot:CAMPEP_0198118698 /NCGR_PEP_ID=MMETSP1442-20131203/22758_1 /TAXON_ID= /ORGANISM="Craspedostauros australis, Strain CCMP3328" /LENGTH=221 /DNA_ID=CAMNT_0043777007 /DNA_START=589 /DNA_END=1252 /DNA_ORIENTATION=+